MKAPALIVLVSLSACAVPARPPPVPRPPAAAPVAPSAGPAAPSPPPSPPPSPGMVSMGEIVTPPSFDPRAVLATLKPELLRCYGESRTLAPSLRGKLTLVVQVADTGTVTGTTASPGGSANDPGLVSCIADVLKAATFPSPGGTATISVPLVFRP